MQAYIAFIRGLNVGGHALVKMTELAKVFAKLGYKDVKTVLATGNVIFTTKKEKNEDVAKEIEVKLKKTIKKDMYVVIWTAEELRQFVASDPFKGVKLVGKMHRYVTFLYPEKAKGILKIPYTSKSGNFIVLKSTNRVVLSTLAVTEKDGTPESILILEKEFGNKITTRNWNTVVKVGEKL